MRYFVQITAQDITVTADDDDEAVRSAESDAREFHADWNYLVAEVRPAGPFEELTGEEDDLEISLEDVSEDEGTYVFDASFDLVVEAHTTDEAGDIAKFFYREQKYGPLETDPEIGASALLRILDYRAKAGDDLLSSVSQIALDGSDAMGMISIAYEALTKIRSTDPAHSMLEQILQFEKRDGGYDGADAAGILAIASKFEPPTAPSLKP